ncbi:MAG TPA: DNA-processing protein DprA [Bacillota bacterium]|nr:DNA-processing protein DprA [Bacillota bacterium]
MNLTQEDRIYLAALHLAIGSQTRLLKLLEHFPQPRAAWETGPQVLGGLLGWTPGQQEEFRGRRTRIRPAENWEKLRDKAINLLTVFDGNYPENLRNIYDPPVVLYHKGSVTSFPGKALAIVGTRKATSYGKAVAQGLARDLAANGILIVSGLARGIDSAAHRGALEQGPTVGVLGCGPDVVYPRENARLQQEVCDQGAIISEYPPGTPPEAWHFPARNRIISGLALGVVVVEAEEKSGSLITVDSALEQGREVFAVPGNIFAPGSRGTHKLLKQGAIMVTGCQDIREELGLETLFPTTTTPQHTSQKLTLQEQSVLGLLEGEALGIDALAFRSRLDTATLLSVLTYLELKGLVMKSGGQNFQRVPVFS